MKKKKMRRLLAEPVIYSQLTVCFSEKTVEWKGRRIVVDADCVTLPILSDSAVFTPVGLVRLA